MSAALPVGTLAYLVKTVEFAQFHGRPVEVVGHNVEDSTVWHFIDADWIREFFGDRQVQALAANLLPFSDPDSDAEEAQVRQPKAEPAA